MSNRLENLRIGQQARVIVGYPEWEHEKVTIIGLRRYHNHSLPDDVTILDDQGHEYDGFLPDDLVVET